MSEKETVCLIDLSIIFRRFWHQSEGEEISTCARRTVDQILGLAHKYDHVAICKDSPPYKRKEKHPEYKGQREKPDAVMIEQMRKAAASLVDNGFRTIGVKGAEADDVIATICKGLAGQYKIVIASADKDLAQLVSDDVSQYDPMRDTMRGPDDIEKKFGVPPSQMLDFLSLTGDDSDNIDGVPKCGPGTASKLLLAFGDLDGVFTAAKTGTHELLVKKSDGNPKAILVSLQDKENELNARFAKELITLDDGLDIDFSVIFEERKARQMEAPPSGNDIDMDGNEVLAAEVVTQAVAVHEPTAVVDAEYRRQLEPRTMDQARMLCTDIYDSRLFGKWPTVQSIMVGILKGRSLGLDPVTALGALDPIEVRGVTTLALKTVMMVAMIKKSDVCEFWQVTKTTSEMCEITTKHIKDPEKTVFTYTIKEAQTAGLAGNAQYQKRPKTMLRHRCAAELARMVYPDIIMGLHTVEEMEGVE